MRDIAKLLFGDGADRLPSLFGVDDADGFGMADRARRAGEWCASTPGRGPVGNIAGAVGPRGMRHQIVIREFRNG